MKTKNACPPARFAKASARRARRGSGLIFAVILLFVIIGMVITLSSITVLETKMSQKTKSSVGAFYSSESGIEWALNKIANATDNKITGAFSGFGGGKINCAFGSDVCGVYLLDESGNVISDNPGGNRLLSEVKAVRSVGNQTAGESTTRAIEAAVAQSAVCNGTPTEISSEQSTASLKDAATTCRNMGSCWHLPSLDELTIFAGYNNDNDFLWTTSYSNSDDRLCFSVRISDGEMRDSSSDNRTSGSNPFRCVR